MKNIKILLLFVAALSLVSCGDFLDKGPTTSQSTEVTLSDYAGLSKAAYGALMPMYSYYSTSYVLSCEMRSGNGRREQSGDYQSGRYATEYIWNYSADATSGYYSSAYYMILAANNVINNLEGKDVNGVTAQDLNNLKAEALFTRAWALHINVLYYAQPYTYQPDGPGVPITLTSDLEPIGRNTTREVYNQIVADLLEAESIMADDYQRENVTDEKATVNKATIQAFLARVYLYMGEWQNAATYANKVISSGKYQLWTAEELPTVWNKAVADEGGEVIFEMWGDKNNSYYNSWTDISWMTHIGGYADCGVSHDLYDLYTDDDVRKSLHKFADKNGTELIWTTKYNAKGSNQPDCVNIIVFRLAEMYLTRAEAILNGASVTGVTALGDINTLREHRGLEPLTSLGYADVKRERRLELAYEGHYLWDLGRWGDPVERKDFTGDPNMANIPFPSYRWALPLPKGELDINPNLVQNEGY